MYMERLIIELFHDFGYNAILYGKCIGLDKQAFVGPCGADKILPRFKGVQPVLPPHRIFEKDRRS